MNDLISKISSYNIFNYLFPGALFIMALEPLIDVEFVQYSILENLFLFYFVGLIISRVGSLIIEPVLGMLHIIKQSSYEEYVLASGHDKKLDILSSENNQFRTIFTMLFLLVLTIFTRMIQLFFNIPKDYLIYLLLFALVVLFLMSYRKMTRVISKRISIINSDITE